jgi:hypothetical protein
VLNEDETLIRSGYEAYARGDITVMLQMVHPGSGMDLSRSQFALYPGRPLATLATAHLSRWPSGFRASIDSRITTGCCATLFDAPVTSHRVLQRGPGRYPMASGASVGRMLRRTAKATASNGRKCRNTTPQRIPKPSYVCLSLAVVGPRPRL